MTGRDASDVRGSTGVDGKSSRTALNTYNGRAKRDAPNVAIARVNVFPRDGDNTPRV
jgi:hypothetical protein